MLSVTAQWTSAVHSATFSPEIQSRAWICPWAGDKWRAPTDAC